MKDLTEVCDPEVCGGFIVYGWRLYREYSDALAKETFRYSIWYLSLLFGVMLVDHYFKFPV